jgi:alkylation response protein AidB-like acyl-CoA dehydrogenase
VDLAYSTEDEAFRRELRAWLDRAVQAHGPPPPPQDWPARRAYETRWQKGLSEAGYAGIHWPREVGGRGASLVQQLVYYEEIARARAPNIGVNFVGLQHGGPTLIAEGTPEQKQAHLPRILRGEEVWCQGFSEPSAGSDLASLSTRAVKDGDHYVITGHKIWTSYAQVADYCELLVRTDPTAPKHKGITWLIMPMNLRGIEIRPLRTILGESEFSEVFLDEVRVPVSSRVGAENDGWRVANVTLRFERGTSFAGWIIELEQFVDALKEIAGKIMDGDRPLIEDVALVREMGHASAELSALWSMVKLSVSESEKTGVPGLLGSAIKLYYSELYQRIADMGLRILGRASLSTEDIDHLPCRDVITKAMHSLSLTIAAGTSQIQRNIIAERILGLPK